MPRMRLLTRGVQSKIMFTRSGSRQPEDTHDVMGLGERIERAEALGDWDSLINDARAAGVPGFRR